MPRLEVALGEDDVLEAHYLKSFPMPVTSPSLPFLHNLSYNLLKSGQQENEWHVLRLYTYMCLRGLEIHQSLGNYLVQMLAQVGNMCVAQQVFDRLVYTTERSWNSLIIGYLKHGDPEFSLTLYEKMQMVGSVYPSCHTYAAILKACTKLKNAKKGFEIHSEVARRGFLQNNVYIGSTLVDMYAKCGFLAKARQVFQELRGRDVVVWNALLTGLNESGHDDETLKILESMQSERVFPNAVTLICGLKASGGIKRADKGLEIHSEIEKQGLLKDNHIVGSALVDMYAKCGLLGVARQVLDRLPSRNVVSWTALVTGYTEHGQGEAAIECFNRMQMEGISPNSVALASALRAYGSIKDIDQGQEIHGEIERQGFLGKDVGVGNSLIDMYVKCGSLVKAQQVFDRLPVRNVASWTTLIVGYAEQEKGEDAVKWFEEMQHEMIPPDIVTLVSSLKACGSIGDSTKGKEIHDEIERRGFLEHNLVVGNALVDMYAKSGSLFMAQQVFDRLPIRDVVTWNALIAGYTEHEYSEEALTCLENMQFVGVCADMVTFVCSLKACGSVGAMGKGQEIHAEIERQGLLEKDFLVGRALVDMYSKCGSLAKAQEVFEKLKVQDVVSWTALMAGYSQCCENNCVFYMFDRMRGEGLQPDAVTFVVVLNACSRAGLYAKSQSYFEAMSTNYGIVPMLEHFTCIVDLLGRSGHPDKALEIIKRMPPCPNLAVWHSLLGSCRNWGNMEVGKHAFEHGS